MSVRQLKIKLREWIESIVRIDAWELDAPRNVPTVIDGRRYPANCAIDLPVQSLDVRKAGDYLEASASFTYFLVYRFSAKASKQQLPIGSVESLVNYLLERAVAYPYEIWDEIIALEVKPTSTPVTIARVEGDDQDWLIVARIEFDITFNSNAEADFANLQPIEDLAGSDEPYRPTQINLGLNRSIPPVRPNDPNTFRRDRLIEILLPTDE